MSLLRSGRADIASLLAGVANREPTTLGKHNGRAKRLEAAAVADRQAVKCQSDELVAHLSLKSESAGRSSTSAGDVFPSLFVSFVCPWVTADGKRPPPPKPPLQPLAGEQLVESAVTASVVGGERLLN